MKHLKKKNVSLLLNSSFAKKIKSYVKKILEYKTLNIVFLDRMVLGRKVQIIRGGNRHSLQMLILTNVCIIHLTLVCSYITYALNPLTSWVRAYHRLIAWYVKMFVQFLDFASCFFFLLSLKTTNEIGLRLMQASDTLCPQTPFLIWPKWHWDNYL